MANRQIAEIGQNPKAVEANEAAMVLKMGR
jgi:hypothetical protein